MIGLFPCAWWMGLIRLPDLMYAQPSRHVCINPCRTHNYWKKKPPWIHFNRRIYVKFLEFFTWKGFSLRNCKIFNYFFLHCGNTKGWCSKELPFAQISNIIIVEVASWARSRDLQFKYTAFWPLAQKGATILINPLLVFGVTIYSKNIFKISIILKVTKFRVCLDAQC